MANWIGCALVELVVIFKLLDIFLAICWVMLVSAKVTICDCLEASVHLERLQRVAARPFSIHWVQGLHLGQVILAVLVVALHPGWLLLVWLDIVDQVPVATASCIIVIGHSVVSLVHAKFYRGINKLALELGLFRVENHFLAVLIWLELIDLARVVGGGLGEFHAHARRHQHFLVCFTRHKCFLVLQLTLAIYIMTKNASYRVCWARVGLISWSIRLSKSIWCSSCSAHHCLLLLLLVVCFLCWGWLSWWAARWVFGEGNVDAVDFLVMLFSLLRGEGVRLLCLLRPNARVFVSHAIFCILKPAEINQLLRLECLVRFAFDSNAIIGSLRCDLADRFLHSWLCWLFWACKN